MRYMKAVVLTRYGSPEMLQLQQVEKPTPGDHDVLIRIIASTVTLGDCEIRTLTLPWWTRFPVRLVTGFPQPKKFIPGMEMSGVIEAVGKKVTEFKPGDAVFSSSGLAMGGNAEYICRPAKSPIALKPSGASFEEVATLPVGGINALHFLRKANIQPGQKVLIIGAGGSIGTYGVQIARLYGAEVTAVDCGAKLQMLQNIGAQQVIDYQKEDFASRSIKYDVIFDMIYDTSFSKCIGCLTETGIYLMANPSPAKMIRSVWVSLTTRKKAIFQFAAENTEDLTHLANHVATRRIRPVIDKRFSLDSLPQAHEYVEKNLKQGCVIINCTPPLPNT
jgi:NADPH:quinone reductase-like Zn-dependent oxidoreductase